MSLKTSKIEKKTKINKLKFTRKGKCNYDHENPKTKKHNLVQSMQYQRLEQRNNKKVLHF